MIGMSRVIDFAARSMPIDFLSYAKIFTTHCKIGRCKYCRMLIAANAI
jgi:hypothetical protein